LVAHCGRITLYLIEVRLPPISFFTHHGAREVNLLSLAFQRRGADLLTYLGFCDNPLRKIPYYHLRPIHFSH
jgi:hypothetical protein